MFFLSAAGGGAGLEPIGFVSTPGPVTAVSWSDDGSKLLVGCDTGDVLEIVAPVVGSVDTSHTYEISLQVGTHEQCSPRHRVTFDSRHEGSECV